MFMMAPLTAEEILGANQIGQPGSIAELGVIKRNKGSRAANLRIILEYLQSKDVFCGGIENMIEDMYGSRADGSSDDESGDNDEGNDESSSKSSDSGSEEIEPILLLVWKVFEHLRGRKALFGAPLPNSPTAFATEMLLWSQKQSKFNHEADPMFPLRIPSDLTSRFLSILFRIHFLPFC